MGRRRDQACTQAQEPVLTWGSLPAQVLNLEQSTTIAEAAIMQSLLWCIT